MARATKAPSDVPLREEDLPPLTGSKLLDPWRIRLRQELRGELAPPPARRPTASEERLWEALLEQQAGWCREYTTGRYRLDFYLPAAALAVEVDGGSHFGQVARERDDERDAWHRARGIRTLRVADHHVLRDLPGVLALIGEELRARSLLAQLATTSEVLRDEVADLTEAAPAVQAEIVRLAAACETVLPAFAKPGGLLRRLAPLR